MNDQPRMAEELPALSSASGRVHTVIPERHLYKIPEAMLLLSMSRSVIYEQMRAGRLKYVKQGSSTLIPATAINEYVELLMRESEVHHGHAS